MNSINSKGKHNITGLQQNCYVASYYNSKSNIPIVGQPEFNSVRNFGPIQNSSFSFRLISPIQYNTLENVLRSQLSHLNSTYKEIILSSYLQGCVYN